MLAIHICMHDACTERLILRIAWQMPAEHNPPTIHTWLRLVERGVIIAAVPDDHIRLLLRLRAICTLNFMKSPGSLNIYT